MGAGSLEVAIESDAGRKPIAELEPGDAFGEMSVLTDAPAMAAVTARTKCWLLFLPRQEVTSILSDPRIRPRVEAIIRDRQRQNAALDADDALDHSLSLD